jgi:hypothetical protein
MSETEVVNVYDIGVERLEQGGARGVESASYRDRDWVFGVW